jgi:hypothetical protein
MLKMTILAIQQEKEADALEKEKLIADIGELREKYEHNVIMKM